MNKPSDLDMFASLSEEDFQKLPAPSERTLQAAIQRGQRERDAALDAMRLARIDPALLSRILRPTR